MIISNAKNIYEVFFQLIRATGKIRLYHQKSNLHYNCLYSYQFCYLLKVRNLKSSNWLFNLYSRCSCIYHFGYVIIFLRNTFPIYPPPPKKKPNQTNKITKYVMTKESHQHTGFSTFI